MSLSDMTAGEISDAMLSHQPDGWKNCDKCGAGFWTADDKQVDCRMCLDAPPTQTFESIVAGARNLTAFIHPHLAGERARATILHAGFSEAIADEAYIRERDNEIKMLENFKNLHDRNEQARLDRIYDDAHRAGQSPR